MIRWILLVLALSCAWRGYRRFHPTTLEVIFWDVGQGDSALVRFPGGNTWLIDAGGGFQDWDVGRRILYGELARLGVLSIDAAILSHPDQDHGYGFQGLWRGITAREFWVNGREDLARPKPLLRRLFRAAAVEEIAVRLIEEEERSTVSGAQVRAIPLGAPEEPSNNRALALWIEWKGCSFAFTGDMERKPEGELFRRIPSVTVLKVAHHGSKTSSFPESLMRAHPEWAVLSSGAGNHYGHPHPRIMERLRNLGAIALRTDFHGFVRFTVSSEGTIQCESGRGLCGLRRCEEP